MWNVERGTWDVERGTWDVGRGTWGVGVVSHVFALSRRTLSVR